MKMCMGDASFGKFLEAVGIKADFVRKLVPFRMDSYGPHVVMG